LNTVVWHEVECGAYTADLSLWEELADAYGADVTIMELGCGAGRVTLHLAQRDVYLVIGVDWDSDLVAAVWEHSGKLPGDAEVADVRSFEFATKFSLVIAPMQLIQLLRSSQDRIACLSCVVDSMLPGGHAAFAIVEEMPILPPGSTAPPLPDVRQIEGWIYSSLPLEPIAGPDSILIRRLRQTVDPDGNMSDEMNEIELAVLSAETLEEEGRTVGLQPAGRREIPPTEAHVGSTVVLFEKEA
jgi:SAM-dependent methyltransferase